jgi:8-oxo-dGTP diphosphatase
VGDRACVAVWDNGRLLMVRQAYRSAIIWTFPGGGIEPGESPERAAVREAQEEVRLDVQLIRLLSRRPRTGGTGVYYCYLGRIVGGELALGTDPELPSDDQQLLACQWFPLDLVRDHPEVAAILPALVQRTGCRPL